MDAVAAPDGRKKTPRPRRETISAGEARRIALAAQGFGPRPPAEPTPRDLHRRIEKLGVLQIDSVNVLVRSHYLPLFSRQGRYAPELLDAAAWSGRGRKLFEYWGHEASLLPIGFHPLFRWRMERAARGEGTYGMIARFGRERADFIGQVYAELAARGPSVASELAGGERGSGSWWGWSQGKAALEWLFWAGRVTTVRRRGFERVYDLTERTLPSAILSLPTPSPKDAQRMLLHHAAKALGVATERDLRDYFRLDVAATKLRIAELVETGDLIPVSVAGWRNPGYFEAKARVPRRIEARALLSPFDSLIWERARTERIFDFRYRLAFYTPADRREHGYYVLPFLLGDRLVGRVDLKSDRKGRKLLVCALHLEEGIDQEMIAAPLDEELDALAAWLGHEHVNWIGSGRQEAVNG